ncbi:hypothetical protein [Kordiimonas pumila]|uniref:TonB C-terminal domain-containing protein n=1 Tax=Kordiimonas pumila TaxID=2161677 RepID=A0ABV7D390_9PROT|nr:hypothetical protein [Kordiimonas pumila]
MKFILMYITVFACSSFALANDPAALQAKIDTNQKAYVEAESLRNKAVAFLLAGKIYKDATSLYKNTPHQYAPFVFLYAKAAATYREPVALSLFTDAIDLYQTAFGAGAAENLDPLLYAAAEATSRNETDQAYEWYKAVRVLLQRHFPNGSFYEARYKMGMAVLYRQAHDPRAIIEAHESIKLLEKFKDPANTYQIATLYYELAETEWDRHETMLAKDAYEKSAALFTDYDTKERRLLTIYSRLIDINYTLQNTAAVCENIIKFITFRPWANRYPAYDPSTRYTTWMRGRYLAEVSFTMTIGPDCKAHDIDISTLKGNDINQQQVESWLKEMFFFPGDLKNTAITAPVPYDATWRIFDISMLQNNR